LTIYVKLKVIGSYSPFLQFYLYSFPLKNYCSLDTFSYSIYVLILINNVTINNNFFIITFKIGITKLSLLYLLYYYLFSCIHIFENFLFDFSIFYVNILFKRVIRDLDPDIVKIIILNVLQKILTIVRYLLKSYNHKKL